LLQITYIYLPKLPWHVPINEEFLYITYEYLCRDVTLVCEACTVGLIMYAATVHILLDYEQS